MKFIIVFNVPLIYFSIYLADLFNNLNKFRGALLILFYISVTTEAGKKIQLSNKNTN